MTAPEHEAGSGHEMNQGRVVPPWGKELAVSEENSRTADRGLAPCSANRVTAGDEIGIVAASDPDPRRFG